MTVLPGAVRQIGYVVSDIDAVLASWVNLGIGPWFVMRNLAIRALYRGEPCEITLTLALANSGDLQVELIQQHDDTPSIYTEFLSGRTVPDTTNWLTGADDFDATMASVRDAGWPVVWLGDEDVGTRFAYVEPPNSPATYPIIEIMEVERNHAGMATFVRDAARNWDGSDPIRVLGG